MIEITQVESFINKVSSYLIVQKEFRDGYDKFLALDFNPLSFFKINENKTSEILAFFLNPEESHAQNDIFLNIFLQTLNLKDDVGKFQKITVEYATLNKRRIDILIEFEFTNIGIENKIWAGDQSLQIQDYADYLASKKSKKNVLIYLTPDGKNPAPHSIQKENFNKLEQDKRLVCLSYKEDIIEMIEKWNELAKASSVKNFLSMFNQDLMNKFFPSKLLIMDNNLKNIIRTNTEAASAISQTYWMMESQAKSLVDELAIASKKYDFRLGEVQGKFVNPWTELGIRYFRYDLKYGENAINIQLGSKELTVDFAIWFPETVPVVFKEFCESKGFGPLMLYLFPEDKDKLFTIFIDYTNEAIRLLNEFDER